VSSNSSCSLDILRIGILVIRSSDGHDFAMRIFLITRSNVECLTNPFSLDFSGVWSCLQVLVHYFANDYSLTRYMTRIRVLHVLLIDSEDIYNMTLSLYHTREIPPRVIIPTVPWKKFIIARNLEANGLHFDYPVHAAVE
jgi:hypothetical protein